jgi:tetratricopeptide (TPR) repeat protein
VRGYAFLVLLNACESATSLNTSVSNLAYTLAIEGLPYALGMQFSVPDAAALKLTRFFYRFLATGHSVEEAVRQARMALAASDDLAGLKDYVMGIPVLYTSLVRGFARFRVEPGAVEIRETMVRQEFDTEISEAALFRGRRQELAEIGQRLQKGAKVLTLVGPGGSGKSVLARKAASRFAWRFADGILGLSLEHLPTKEEIISRLADWLLGSHVETLAPDAREREVIAAFKTSQTLLILDNYETLLATLEASTSEVKKKARALGQFVRRLVGDKGTLLVMTRDRPTGLPGEGQPLEVPDLDLVAALQLFRDNVGERWQETDELLLASLQYHAQLGYALDDLPPALEGQPLLRLIRNTGPHALAIELLAGIFAEGYESITDIAAGWQDRLREAKDRYRDCDERHVTLAACFEYSYRTLPPEAKDLFPSLSIFTAPFLARVVEPVFSRPEAGKFLNLLFRKSLLHYQETVYGLGFYFFHPMARWYAEKKADGVDLAPLRKALGRTYLNFARNIDRKLNPATSIAARVMLPDLRKAMDVLPSQEQSRLAFHLAWLFEFFGDLTRAMELYQESLHIKEQLGDLRGKSATLHEMAIIYRMHGELERAMELYQNSLDLTEQLSDLRGKSATLHEMAYIYWMRGDLERAMKLYQESLEINEQLGDLQGKSVTRAMRGQLLAAAGEKVLALQDFVQALATLAHIGAHDAGQVVDMIRRLRGDVGDEEFNSLWRTVTGQEELPEWLAESSKTNFDRLLTLATTQEEQKDWKAANATYSEVLSLLQRRTLSHDEQRRRAETVLRLGVCLRQDGQWGAAVERLQEAFRLFKHLKDFHGQGLAYLETARAYHAMNSYDLAMLYYKDASRLFKRAGDPALAAAAHEEAGNLQVYLRAFPGAIVDLQEAVRLYREANIPSRSAIVDQNLELARQSHE